MKNRTIINLSLLGFILAGCQTAPERVDKKQINNPTLHAELMPLEKEIVDTNYRIKKQMEREKEFIQSREDVEKKYKDADKVEKENLKPELEKAKLKARIETERREALQLKLKERIARYEFKKAAMLSSESEAPLELKNYEKFHKDSESRLKSKEMSVKKMEDELALIEATPNPETRPTAPPEQQQ